MKLNPKLAEKIGLWLGALLVVIPAAAILGVILWLLGREIK